MEQTDAISRSAAIEALNQHSYETSRDYDKTVELLNELPALDVAPVVRCKDCKHWGMLEGPPETEHIKCCEFGQYMVGANGYCVYGEVKDND